LADSAKAAGEYLGAARYAWVASKLGDQGRMTKEAWVDSVYWAVDLLALVPEAQRGEDAVRTFEMMVVNAAAFTALGSERNVKAAKRLAELTAGAETPQFESKVAEAITHVVRACTGPACWRELRT